MNTPARFPGLPVSAGTAAGVLAVAVDSPASGPAGQATPEEVARAFAAVAAERSALASGLRAAGRDTEAGIIEIGALMAADPALAAEAVAAVQAGTEPASAVRATTDRHAAVMARLDNPVLAERAADIRQVGDAVLDRLAGRDRSTVASGRAEPFILVRREVTATDLIELAEAGLAGAVSVAGGASSHAAIIARGLGLPMLVGADPAVLDLPAGQRAVLDADAGELLAGAELTPPTRAPASPQAALPAGPARTRDGHEVTVLVNVASAVETRRGLAAGADGVGLLRTEIPYLQAGSWPGRDRQRAQLDPILALLGGRAATVRLLDFSGDKVPPFLAGTRDGLTALLASPAALDDQLRAILAAGRGTQVRVLVPMVRSLGQVARVRSALAAAAARLGAALPPLGIMVELQETAADAAAFAAGVDFFSVGTNDLTGDVLGLDRRDPGAGPGQAAHPRVLALVKRVVEAAEEAGIGVCVCGDAAADPRVLPLLVGLGVREVSVAAATVSATRSWITELDAAGCERLAARALRASTAAEVWDLVARR